MKIKFNEVTWYSKLAAIVFFLGIFPALTFYLVVRYNEATSDFKIISPAVDSNTSNKEINKELVETKFKLFILHFWQVENVIKNPANDSQFFFATTDSSGGNIWMYDVSKDKTFQKTGSFDFTGNTLLFNRPLKKFDILEVAGVVDNKLVFFQTSNDDSPGPCFSNWFRSKLEYIDLGITYQNVVAKPYIVPAEIIKSENQKADECQKTL